MNATTRVHRRSDKKTQKEIEREKQRSKNRAKRRKLQRQTTFSLHCNIPWNPPLLLLLMSLCLLGSCWESIGQRLATSQGPRFGGRRYIFRLVNQLAIFDNVHQRFLIVGGFVVIDQGNLAIFKDTLDSTIAKRRLGTTWVLKAIGMTLSGARRVKWVPATNYVLCRLGAGRGRVARAETNNSRCTENALTRRNSQRNVQWLFAMVVAIVVGTLRARSVFFLQNARIEEFVHIWLPNAQIDSSKII